MKTSKPHLPASVATSAAANTLLLARFETCATGKPCLGPVTAGCLCALHLTDGGTETVTPQLAPQLTLTFTPEPLGMLFALVAGSPWPLACLYDRLYARRGRKPHALHVYCHRHSCGDGHCAVGQFADAVYVLRSADIFHLPACYHMHTEAKQAGRIYLGTGDQLGRILLSGVISVWLLWHVDFASGGTGDRMDSAVATVAWAVRLWHRQGAHALASLVAGGNGRADTRECALHVVAVVKAGVCAPENHIYIFGVDFLGITSARDWLSGAAFPLAASIVALSKTNLKARLAYSTISQFGYIVLGAALASPLEFHAALHIATHATGKLLFFAPERLKRITCQNSRHDGWAGAG